MSRRSPPRLSPRSSRISERPVAESHIQVGNGPSHSINVSCPPPQGQQSDDLLSGIEDPDFELSTPMLVMPFSVFKQQGRIFKSIKAWREEALATGKLIKFAWVEGGSGKLDVNGKMIGRLVVMEGKIAIFISHT